METITFTCQTITPMLMHGADGSTAELRPASIKGVLRFWWRAIHGNLPNIEALKKAEAEIFGSSAIIPSSNPMTHTFKIKISFKNTNNAVYPGMYATIDID